MNPFKVITFALVTLASAPSFAEMTKDEMQVIMDQQMAVIEALTRQLVPETTNVDPEVPPEPQIVEATSPQSLFVNHEARISNPVYVTEVPTLTEVHTKIMPVPSGWEMVEVEHPPKFSCTEYLQPSTWEMRKIYQPPTIQPVLVGEDNVDSITIITEGE